ncbi:proline-rich protein 18 [Equus quagga]|uniref:proline-rich protein 18 n=1 Tax=Equus quagga TaxID=89248 RepID=UPI001EE161B5|nr:proline-rich protein 18 [Equus quagga]
MQQSVVTPARRSQHLAGPRPRPARSAPPPAGDSPGGDQAAPALAAPGRLALSRRIRPRSPRAGRRWVRSGDEGADPATDGEGSRLRAPLTRDRPSAFRALMIRRLGSTMPFPPVPPPPPAPAPGLPAARPPPRRPGIPRKAAAPGEGSGRRGRASSTASGARTAGSGTAAGAGPDDALRFSLSLTPEAVLLIQRRHMEKQLLARPRRPLPSPSADARRLLAPCPRATAAGLSRRPAPPGGLQALDLGPRPADLRPVLKVSLLNERHKYDDVEYEEEAEVVDEGLVRKCTEWLRGVESAAGRAGPLDALPHLSTL